VGVFHSPPLTYLAKGRRRGEGGRERKGGGKDEPREVCWSRRRTGGLPEERDPEVSSPTPRREGREKEGERRGEKSSGLLASRPPAK